MILVADSGSTKTQWCLLHKNEVVKEILRMASILFTNRRRN
jgi:hypothetical protein